MMSNTANNSLFVFPETGAKVRVVQIEGSPWFSLIDVAAVLGWTGDNTKYHAKQTLGADERRVVKLPTVLRGIQRQIVVAESGLYKLVMRSDKPQARKFQDWVTRDVLPAIRKEGVYVRGEEVLKDPVGHGLDLNDLDALRPARRMASTLFSVVGFNWHARGATWRRRPAPPP